MELKTVETAVTEASLAVSGIVFIVSKVTEDAITTWYDLKARRNEAKRRAERIAKYPAKRSLKSIEKEVR